MVSKIEVKAFGTLSNTGMSNYVDYCLITPCSRPENLPDLQGNIAEVLTPNGSWMHVWCEGKSHSGNLQRNYCLDWVGPALHDNSIVGFLDDDNLLSPPMGVCLWEFLYGKDQALIVDQAWGDSDQVRLRWNPDKPSWIDSACFFFKWGAIGDVRWPDEGYRGDQKFFWNVYRKLDPIKEVMHVPQLLAWYNALEPDPETTWRDISK